MVSLWLVSELVSLQIIINFINCLLCWCDKFDMFIMVDIEVKLSDVKVVVIRVECIGVYLYIRGLGFIDVLEVWNVF